MRFSSFTAFTLLALLLLTGCNQPDAQLAEDIRMYESTWDAVMNEGKLEEINETHFTTDVVTVSGTDETQGLEAFRDYYGNFLTGFSDIEFTILDAFGQGDKIVKHWRFKGKHTGEFFGIPASGNDLDIKGVTLVEMRDGKIAREEDVMDNDDFYRQLGLTSSPGNTEVINGIYQAFASGDMPTVLGSMDAGIVWNEAEGNAMADGNPYVGPDAVLQGVFARIGAEYEYFNLKDIELHDMSGNQVLATLRYNGKIKKSGKPIDAQAAHLWTLKNGKVTAFQQYTDTKQLADAAR
jgi:hypothetical protein